MNWGLLFNEFVNERGARLSHAKVLIVLLLDIVLNCLIGLTRKSASVLFYHMISCVRYEDSAIWMLHLNLVCLYLIDFATQMY